METFKHVRGLKELDTFLAQLPNNIQYKLMRGALRAGINVIKDEVKANVPVKSGTLRAGIKVSTRSSRGVVSAKVKTTGKHAHIARWLEYGVAAHIIRPRRKKSLSFGGTAVEGVNHPGLKPKPFMRPALDKRAQEALTVVAQQMKARLTKEGLQGANEVDTDE